MSLANQDFDVPRDRGLFRRAVDALARGLQAHARRASRRDMIEALEAKSDAELAQMGLRRHEIARYVFRDLLYR